MKDGKQGLRATQRNVKNNRDVLSMRTPWSAMFDYDFIMYLYDI